MRRRYAPARVIKARFEADVAPFALEGAQSVEMDGRAVKVTFLPEQAHADALIASLASRGSLADLTVEDTDVEELVAQGEADLTMRQAVSMVWLQQVAGSLVPGWNTDIALYTQIRSGDVAYELLRPMDAYAHWYVKSLAGRLGPFLLALVPVLGVGLLVPEPWGLGAPASPLHALACLLTLLSGVFTSCAMILLSYAMLLDVRVGDAPSRMAVTVAQILSGLYLPLQLWPEAMQTFLYYQPFAGMLDLPVRLYVGAQPLARAGEIVLLQAFWTAVFVLAGRAWIGRSFRKLVIQGG